MYELPKASIEAIKDKISDLGRIRNCSQFLFCDKISPFSPQLVRKGIQDYLQSGQTRDQIDFIINSPGGSPADAYRIIRTLRNAFDQVNIIIPFWAKSAATLLSLGGHQVIMDEFGEFGPLDMQLAKQREDSYDFEYESALNEEHSLGRIEYRARQLFLSMFTNLHSNERYPIPKGELSDSLFKFVSNFYEPLLRQIDPYKLGEKKRKLDIGEDYARRIMIQYHQEVPREDAEIVIDYLINGCPDHGYVIDYEILSPIFPYIKKSDIFGDEYKETLSELSVLFMQYRFQETYIGIIEHEVHLETLSSQLNVKDSRPRSEETTG